MPVNAGSYIKHYCSRCGLELGHTIVAVVKGQPARIRCDTCKSERNYKAVRPETDSANRIRAPIRQLKNVDSDMYQKKLRDSVMKTPRKYSAIESFEVGDVVDHPKFGRGVVTKLLFPDRMDILFQDEGRTLLCKVPENASSE